MNPVISNTFSLTAQKNGEDAFIIDISNDNDTFGTDSTGKVIEAQLRTTKVKLYVGSEQQILTENPTVVMTYASDGASVASDVAEATIRTGSGTLEGTVTVTVKANKTVTDAIYVDISAKCVKGTKTKRFTLKPVKSGTPGVSPELWQLAPDHDALSFGRDSNDELTPDSIDMKVYAEKCVGATKTKYTSSQTGWKIYWGFDESATAQGNGNVGMTINITKAQAASHTQVWVELRNSSDNYSDWVDRETIPINKDGKAGTSYKLLPNPSELNVGRTSSGGYNPRYNSLKCGYKKTVGETTTTTSEASGNIDSTLRIFYRKRNRSTGAWESTYYYYNDSQYYLSLNVVSGVSNSGLDVETYDNVEFVLYKDTTNRSLSSLEQSKIVDRMTVSVVADGQKGGNGNGINTDDFYYCLTATIVPPSTSSLTTANGWYKQGASGCPTQPTNAKPYLWQCEHIVYTNDSSLNKDIVKLVNVYNMGMQPNLLEQTGFDSEDVMDKWKTAEGQVVPQARGQNNAWGAFPGTNTYSEMLQQVVFNPGSISKIKNAHYYTLSFYSRTRRYVNVTGYTDGFYSGNIYLKAGTYKLQFNGRCSIAASNAGVNLKGKIWYSGDYGQTESLTGSVSASITSTSDTTVTTGTLTVTQAGYYKIGFDALGNTGNADQSVTVNWWRIKSLSDNARIDTYCYPSAVVSGSTYFVDGEVKSNLAGDCSVVWHLDNDDDLADSGGWTRHSVTFLTKDTITSEEQRILFRIFKTYVEICQPKLEECVMATPWCEHEADSDMHCDHNPCGTWSSGTTYYYCNGQRDVVQAKISSTNTSKTWYRMKKRTTSQGYTSTIEPYNDSEHWEKANNLKFSIVDAMFAEEIFTDKLTVSKIRGANGKFTVDENGNVVGSDCKFTNGDFSGTIKASLIYQKFTGNPGAVDGNDITDYDVIYIQGEWGGNGSILPQASEIVGKTIKIVNHIGYFPTTRSYRGEAPIKVRDVTKNIGYGNGTYPDLFAGQFYNLSTYFSELEFIIKTGFKNERNTYNGAFYFPANILELLATEQGWVVLNCRGYILTAKYNNQRYTIFDFDEIISDNTYEKLYVDQ